MKISDILTEELAKEISGMQKSEKLLQKEPSGKNWSRLGRPGQQAIAYERKHLDNDKVIKVVEVRDSTDPAYQFLRLCKNHQNNPHFPKIYSVKQYPYKNGGYQLIIVMEKLYHIPHNDDTIYQLFGIPDNGIIDLYINNLVYMFSEEQTRKIISELTKFNSLKQALRLLEPLFKNYLPDMHSGNIMYRKSQKGPQLVFVDPIQYDV